MSVSLLLITYRKYSEFIQKNGWMLQCFSKMAQPFSIHGWIDNFWLLLLCSHGKKSWWKLCGLMWHWWNHLLLQSFHFKIRKRFEFKLLYFLSVDNSERARQIVWRNLPVHFTFEFCLVSFKSTGGIWYYTLSLFTSI